MVVTENQMQEQLIRCGMSVEPPSLVILHRVLTSGLLQPTVTVGNGGRVSWAMTVDALGIMAVYALGKIIEIGS